jgi:hypothetical protein
LLFHAPYAVMNSVAVKAEMNFCCLRWRWSRRWFILVDKMKLKSYKC